VSGTALVRSGKLRVSVQRRLGGKLRRVRGVVRIRNLRWTRRLRLRGRLARARRVTLVVTFGAQGAYRAQTLRRGLRRKASVR
jgi:hypothetical protein